MDVRPKRKGAGSKLASLLDVEKSLIDSLEASGTNLRDTSTPKTPLTLNGSQVGRQVDREIQRAEKDCEDMSKKLQLLKLEHTRLELQKQIEDEQAKLSRMERGRLDTSCSGGDQLQRYLEAAALSLKSSAWSASTRRTYTVHLKTYLKFCAALSITPVPMKADMLELYIAYLVKFRQLSYQSVVSYLCIVSHLHDAEGYDSPVHGNWHIKQILTGVKRVLGDGQNCVQPITPDILFAIKGHLDFSLRSDLSFWAACLIGFFGMLRPNNFLKTKDNKNDQFVRRLDASRIDEGFLINLRYTKTVQFRSQVVHVFIPEVGGHSLCPATALATYLEASRSASQSQPLFMDNNHTPLTYRGFLQRLRKILAQCGYSAHRFGGHSFRRGGGTWAHKMGLSDGTIQRIGCWKSDAFLRYIDSDMHDKVASVRQMVVGIKDSC